MNDLPDLKGLVFESFGCRLLGALYCAGGPGLHPTAVLLHGVPGLEKNTDLAYALQEEGWNTLIFHYRGCWGSEGDYTMAGMPDDVCEAVQHVTCGRYPVDPQRIAVIGHGLGGWAALVAASREHSVRAVVTLSGVVNTRTALISEQATDGWVHFLRGAISRGLQSQWRALGAMYNPVDLIADIEPRPMLIIHGTADTVVPPSQALEFKQCASEDAELFLIEGADHGYVGYRRQLAVKVVSWLNKNLQS